MNSLLNIRALFAETFLLCVASMAFALFYLQYTLGLPPCPLCMTQRLFVVLTAVFCLFAAIHNPQGWGRRVYASLSLISATLGGAVAARHIWLQSLPEDLVPACGPSLEYMLDTFPLSETFALVMMGDGNCADVVWTFLGLSIPQQTLGLFLVLAGLSAYQMLRRR
jgi:disulfide bond formation protein DsbB